MTRLQIGLLASSLVLLFVLYFGCETTPNEVRAIEKSRALEVTATNEDVLEREAKASLSPEALNEVLGLEQELQQAPDDSLKLALLQDLSGTWFRLEQPAIAGYYAERAAQILADEQSWSIAATTYTICVQRSEAGRIREFCTEKAVQAYENAISLNPSNLTHKVNLALLFAENPPADNPMRGVTMLVDLNRQEPENVLVLNSLGRLAIRTGQYDRALIRLNEALRLEPDNRNTLCLLAQAYEGLGDTQQAQVFGERCRQLNEAAESS